MQQENKTRASVQQTPVMYSRECHCRDVFLPFYLSLHMATVARSQEMSPSRPLTCSDAATII